MKLRHRGYLLVIVPQCLAEFWAVSTRPSTARGGYGLTTAQALQKMKLLERRFPLLDDTPQVHRYWRRLVAKHNVQGVETHDARLVAAMRTHGITHVLTLNDADYNRYPNTTAINPTRL